MPADAGPAGGTPWARRLGLGRPVLGPLGIALLTLALFHVVVAFARPQYWFGESAWDEGYYLQIARQGYSLPDGDFSRFNCLPFSPGWPLLLRAVAWLTGLDPLSLRLPISALLFVLACQALGWTLRAFSPDHVRNNLTILFFALWPGSLYFRSGYAEALYLPLLLLCFGCMLRRRWFPAGCLAAACWFTRTPGVVVVFALAAAIVVDAFAGRPARAAWARATVTLLRTMPIAALGMLGYMAMVHAAVGDWFAFQKAYVAWQPCEVITRRSMTFRTVMDALVLFPARPTLRIAVACFLATPILVCLQRRRMPAVLSIFAAGAWLFFLANDWQLEPYHDTLRWMAVVFPFHHALALTFEAARPGLRCVLRVAWSLASAAAFVWCAWLFVTRQWVS